MRRYTETYAYDAVGNLLEVQHEATGGNWTRGNHYTTDGNRLLASSLPGDTVGVPASYSATYAHDAHGNMTAMPHLAAIDWDALDRMQHADLGGGGDVYFQYDAAGNRVRKVRVNTAGTQTEERIYLGTLELYRERTSGVLQLEREALHLADDTARVCMIETRTISGGSPVSSPANDARYQYGNHLGTVSLELDNAANTINYEEYHLYGTSAYRAVDSAIGVSAKRYRYTGKERDEETGLDHMGARYYAPWLGRWTAADPIGLGDGINRYAYVSGNPVGMRDPSGAAGEPFQIGEKITREQAAEFAEDRSIGADGAFPVVLPGGERYHVLSTDAVEVLPGVESGVEGHVAWKFKKGTTASLGYQRAAALEASRVAAERTTEWGAERILASKKMIGAVAVAGVGGAAGTLSFGAAFALARGLGTFGATVLGSATAGGVEGGITGAGWALLDGASTADAALEGGADALRGAGYGAAFGAAAGLLLRTRLGRGLAELASPTPQVRDVLSEGARPWSRAANGGAGEARFIGTESGTAVHRSQAELVESITEAGATRVGPTTATTEAGEIFHLQTPRGPMEIRVMQGRPGGGSLQGPRTINTRPGTTEYVNPDGSRIQGAVPKAERKRIGHIHGQRR